MSTPAAIAGIVVAAVVGTPVIVAILMFGGYAIYKYFEKHPIKLHGRSVSRKTRPSNPSNDNRLVPPTVDDPNKIRLDFDNEAFLNAMSTTKEVEPDQLSQSGTQNTILSALTQDRALSRTPAQNGGEAIPDDKVMD